MKQHNIFGEIDEMQFNKETDKYEIIMNEKQLQFKIVLDFSQKRPTEKGLLWSTRNQTFSAKDGMTQKGMGMVAGVSDLIYFKETFCGLEIKQKGKRHSAKHIKQQLEWGKKITQNGGIWFIVTSLEGFWALLDDENITHNDVFTVEDVETLLSKGTKTVVF